MEPTNSLLDKVQKEHVDVNFKASDSFSWDPASRTIYYSSDEPNADARLLHELAHSLLEHSGYNFDIDLVALERDAWSYARTELTKIYETPIGSDVVEKHMDTYRDWLHARSTCPKCQATGLQKAKNTYCCLVCRQNWRVNEAKICALRRYKQ